MLQFERDDPPQAKLAKLQQTLTRYHFPQADTLSLLAALLSLPQPEGTPPLTLSPQKQKQKTQEALVAWLVEEAEQHPVYCVWEDLHWADPSTLELLGSLARPSADGPVARAVDRAARVHAAVEQSLAPDPTDPDSAPAHAGRRDDREGHWRQAAPG